MIWNLILPFIELYTREKIEIKYKRSVEAWISVSCCCRDFMQCLSFDHWHPRDTSKSCAPSRHTCPESGTSWLLCWGHFWPPRPRPRGCSCPSLRPFACGWSRRRLGRFCCWAGPSPQRTCTWAARAASRPRRAARDSTAAGEIWGRSRTGTWLCP